MRWPAAPYRWATARNSSSGSTRRPEAGSSGRSLTTLVRAYATQSRSGRGSSGRRGASGLTNSNVIAAYRPSDAKTSGNSPP